MRVIYFDGFSGASGDMIVGALLDAGLSLDQLKGELEKLRLPGWEISLGRRVRSGIAAADFDVHCSEEAPERGFEEIRAIIEGSGLSSSVKERAVAVFRRLGEAEARIHATTLDKIHFHEVGAIDCIIDVCAACIGLEMLGVQKVVVSPLPQGHGLVRCAHGRIPVPAPATIELLRGCPTYGVDIEGELVTPTGAALLSTLADAWGRMPSMKPEAIGYGSGQKDFGPRPNLLRVIVGHEATAHPHGAAPEIALSFPGADGSNGDVPPADVVVLEANIDDMNPEGYELAMGRLFDAGALDVTLTPVLMKKGRPGITVSVIAPRGKEEALVEALFRETTTFGIRSSTWHRHTLDREFRTVETPYGPVKVKIGRRDARIYTASPEYEECRRLAEQSGAPLDAVYRAALAAFDRDVASGEGAGG